MDATSCLRSEHELIGRVLDGFDTALAEVRTTGRLEREQIEPFLTFFRDFADRCHHAKEERCLFPCMERCGDQQCMQVMERLLDEHERGRRRVQMMFSLLDDAGSGDAIARDMLLAQSNKFRDLLRGHIGAENHEYFNAADRAITGDDLERLNASYRRADRDVQQAVMLEQGRRVGEELAARYAAQPSGTD
jgi:hemerythrin-like domain-containing protein